LIWFDFGLVGFLVSFLSDWFGLVLFLSDWFDLIWFLSDLVFFGFGLVFQRVVV